MSSSESGTVVAAADKPKNQPSIHATETTLSEKSRGHGTITNFPPLDKATKKKSPGVVGKIGVLRAASRRPLPTDTGNGKYLVKKEYSGLLADVKSLSWAGKIQISCAYQTRPRLTTV